VQLGGWRIGLTHGGGGADDLEDRVAQLFSDVDVIVYGHSHIPANHVRDGVLFFNPGTATGHSRAGRHTLGILTLGETMEGRIVEIQEG
jgi:predicted phosphodiesterase